MTTRRQLIRMMPVLPLAGLATASMLTACGDKQAAAPAPPAEAPPAPVAAAPVAATPAPAPAEAAPAPTASASPAPADAGNLAMVNEKDPQPMALGYVSDATRADKTKYPTYAAGQACGNCALFQGTAGATQGPCPLYPGKHVSVKAWCSAYNKKTA